MKEDFQRIERRTSKDLTILVACSSWPMFSKLNSKNNKQREIEIENRTCPFANFDANIVGPGCVRSPGENFCILQPK